MGSSALTLSYVACGRFDVYAQGAGLSAWDVAAAGLIAERAGATVTSLDGGPWFDLSRSRQEVVVPGGLAAQPRGHAGDAQVGSRPDRPDPGDRPTRARAADPRSAPPAEPLSPARGAGARPGGAAPVRRTGP